MYTKGDGYRLWMARTMASSGATAATPCRLWGNSSRIGFLPETGGGGRDDERLPTAPNVGCQFYGRDKIWAGRIPEDTCCAQRARIGEINLSERQHHGAEDVSVRGERGWFRPEAGKPFL